MTHNDEPNPTVDLAIDDVTPRPAVIWSRDVVMRARRMLEESSRAADASCARCGLPIDYDAEPWRPEAFAIGHQTAWANGPHRDLDQLQPEHAGCRPAEGGV